MPNKSVEKTDNNSSLAKPVFNVTLSVQMNDIMIDTVLAFFDESLSKGVEMCPELWAFYKHLERWYNRTQIARD